MPGVLVSLTVVTQPAVAMTMTASAMNIFVFILPLDNHNRRARQADSGPPARQAPGKMPVLIHGREQAGGTAYPAALLWLLPGGVFRRRGLRLPGARGAR